MKKNIAFVLAGIFIALAGVFLYTSSNTSGNDLTGTTAVALRQAGHQLLLADHDSTSLVLPIEKSGSQTYKLSFQRAITIDPSQMVSFIRQSFEKANLPQHYKVEVKSTEQEVVYSSLIREETDQSIVPCTGRYLPKKYYTIEVLYMDLPAPKSFPLVAVFAFAGVAGVSLFIFKQMRPAVAVQKNDDPAQPLGRFDFYPGQNKLILKSEEIPLTRKECELLMIFASSRNQTIPRDLLVKKVWEDNGIIVGRSLDTYISKLRKKLAPDPSLQIMNVHGIGYKLEVG